MIDYLIQHISHYVDLTEEEIALLVSKVSDRSYLKGQYLLQNGDISNHINFIVKGSIRIFYIDNTGKEHVMLLGIENWWVADMSSFITQMPADYNIQCVGPTTVIRISRHDHTQLLEEVPKLNKYFRIITENAYVATQQRIVRNFSLTAKERYFFFIDKYPEHLHRFPQYMIASYLGITKEFLSKIRSQQS